MHEVWEAYKEKLTPDGLASLALFLPAKPTLAEHEVRPLDHMSLLLVLLFSQIERIANHAYDRWAQKHRPHNASLYVEVSA